MSELVSEPKFPGNRQKYRDFHRRSLRIRLVARNPEPIQSFTTQFPTPRNREVILASQGIKSAHQGINPPDQRTPRFGRDFNLRKPSARNNSCTTSKAPEEDAEPREGSVRQCVGATTVPQLDLYLARVGDGRRARARRCAGHARLEQAVHRTASHPRQHRPCAACAPGRDARAGIEPFGKCRRASGSPPDREGSQPTSLNPWATAGEDRYELIAANRY